MVTVEKIYLLKIHSNYERRRFMWKAQENAILSINVSGGPHVMTLCWWSHLPEYFYTSTLTYISADLIYSAFVFNYLLCPAMGLL